MTREQIAARLTELRSEIQEFDGAHAGQYVAPDSDDGVKWRTMNEELDELERTDAQLEARAERVAQIAQQRPERAEQGAEFNVQRPGVARDGDIFDLSTVRASVSDPREQGGQLKERALRAVEQSHVEEVDEHIDGAKAKANVERLIRRTDSPDGQFSRYLLAVGSPAYKRAFVKYLTTGDSGLMDRQEQAAWTNGQMAQRALNLTGAQGGFAVPFELDTTILNTNNGVANPIRDLARVRQITVDEWRGITSTGITASYVPEATEATDNAPTLGQPTISTERAQAFVPFSIEIGMDWSGIQADLTELFRDAKDVLESAKFVSGTGTNEPFGVLTGTTNTVPAATGLTVTLANLYALKNSLPPRYRLGASPAFIANVAILDRFRQMDTVGSQTAVWADSLQDGTPSRLLSYPVYEASDISGTITNAIKMAVFGDFSRYLIVDRVGMTVELIPHLMGANRRPTGERGLYCYWRNGAKVLDANAFRALVGTT